MLQVVFDVSARAAPSSEETAGGLPYFESPAEAPIACMLGSGDLPAGAPSARHAVIRLQATGSPPADGRTSGESPARRHLPDRQPPLTARGAGLEHALCAMLRGERALVWAPAALLRGGRMLPNPPGGSSGWVELSLTLRDFRQARRARGWAHPGFGPWRAWGGATHPGRVHGQPHSIPLSPLGHCRCGTWSGVAPWLNARWSRARETSRQTVL